MSRLSYKGNQGFIGALQQYWDVEEKARLHRKNTYFEDSLKVSSKDAVIFPMLFSLLVVTIIVCWMIGSIVL